jgi:alpha-N-arabinofuranosidase
MWGAWQIGALSAEDYTKKAVQMAKMLLRTDPSIELVSCGHNGWSDWDRVVLEGLAPFVRYHSVHLYTGSADYWANVLEPHVADRALRVCEASIERIRAEQGITHPIGIAFDEWNVWYRTRTPAGRAGGLEERYDLSDALAVACYLNVFTRHCQSVEIANFAQMVNVIAPIFTRPDGLFLQTVYHPLRLYAEQALGIVLDVFVDSPTVTCDDERLRGLGPFGTLDVTATRDEARSELCVAVINRGLETSGVATRIELGEGGFEGAVRAYEVTAGSPSTTNSFEQPDAVGVREYSLTAAGSALELELTFPKHSLTLLRARTRPL